MYVASNAEDLARKYGSDLTVFNKIFNSTFNNISSNLTERFKVKKEHEFRKTDLNNPRHVALGVDSSMSCYLMQSILYNNTDWTARDVSNTEVFLQYLNKRLSHQIRGKGLAYGSSMHLSLSEGRIVLRVYRASQLTDAYKVIRTLFQNYLHEEAHLEEELVESAKRTLIFSRVASEDTVTGLISQAVTAYIRGTDSRYNRQFINALAKVNADDLKVVAKGILQQFLLPNNTQTVVVCNKGEINKVVDNLNTYGFDIELYKSYEDTFLNFQ